MEAKHTPGPWYFGEDGRYVRESGSDVAIAYVEDDDGHPDPEHARPLPRDANARLIAAAPDLLAFAERVVAKFKPATFIDNVLTLADFDAARAAIARARGGK